MPFTALYTTFVRLLMENVLCHIFRGSFLYNLNVSFLTGDDLNIGQWISSQRNYGPIRTQHHKLLGRLLHYMTRPIGRGKVKLKLSKNLQTKLTKWTKKNQDQFPFYRLVKLYTGYNLKQPVSSCYHNECIHLTDFTLRLLFGQAKLLHSRRLTLWPEVHLLQCWPSVPDTKLK